MFPIAASLFEAQQLNKRQNCSWKQMRSDDCTAAWADWLNDFFFISSSGSTCCTASLVLAAPLFLSLLPSLPLPLQLPTPLTLSPSMHQFLCLNHSPSFTFPPSASYCALLCVSNSDCLQISRILISTSDHGAIITVKSIAKIDFVCLQDGFKVFSHIWNCSL